MIRLLLKSQFLVAFFTIACFYRVECVNITCLRSDYASTQEIAEYYYTVLNLLETLGTSSINTLDYMSYFDQSIRNELNYILARIRGYAHNETQADEWMNITVGVFRSYTTRMLAVQARAYYESFLNLCNWPRTCPRPLLVQCIRAIYELYFRHLDDEFAIPEAEDPILLHELSRLHRMPVHAFSIDRAPYLRIELFESTFRRFVEEPAAMNNNTLARNSNTFVRNNNTLVFQNPLPYSPYENSINDLRILRNAQQYLDYYWDEIISTYFLVNSSFLEDCVDESLQALAITYLNRLTSNWSRISIEYTRMSNIQNQLITTTFLNLLTRFIYEDINWLICHPVLHLFSSDYEVDGLIAQIFEFHDEIMTTSTAMINRLNSILAPYHMNGTIWRLEDFLDSHGYAAGYSLQRVTGMAIVNIPPDAVFQKKYGTTPAQAQSTTTASSTKISKIELV